MTIPIDNNTKITEEEREEDYKNNDNDIDLGGVDFTINLNENITITFD